MKTFRRLLAVVFWSAIMASCFNPPEYPDSPEINFKDVVFRKGGIDKDGNPTPDSVILTLSFKDGNGDIGLSSDDVAPPFNDRWFYLKSPLEKKDYTYQYCGADPKQRCWFFPPSTGSEFDKFVDYSDARKNPKYDTLKTGKPFDKPYNCFNWDLIYYDDDNNPQTASKVYDTLFFVLNPHYNNIFIEIEERTDGNPPYKAFDEKTFFTYPNCGVRPWNGRIPILQEGTGKGTPLEGEIRYAIPSFFFQTIFGAKYLRLKVYIEDRALHQSNLIYTKEFQCIP